MKASTAIIGLGKIGLTYDLDPEGKKISNQVKTHCRAVSLSKNFKVSLLSDVNPASIHLATKLYGGQGFQNLTEGLEKTHPRLIIVAVPTNEHLNTIRKISHIWAPDAYLIEKPFGTSAYEAEIMYEILQQQESKVFVNYMRRYLPNVLNLKTSGLFKERGDLRSVKILGYGTLEHIFSHFFDLLIFLEGTHILGLSKKTKKLYINGKYEFREPSNGINFEFIGVNGNPRECVMSLDYELIKINILSSGKVITISDQKDVVLSSFELEDSLFNSYQSFVLDRIALEIVQTNSNNCISDAIHIHKFIESI